MNIKIKDLNKANTIEDLEKFEDELGRLDYDISYRGGGLGFYGDNIASYLNIDTDDLPNKYGCGCNYLGGGVRGAIFASGYSDRVPARKAKWLDALAEACIRAYNSAEEESGLQAEVDADGETNWDNLATRKARLGGTVSAY